MGSLHDGPYGNCCFNPGLEPMNEKPLSLLQWAHWESAPDTQRTRNDGGWYVYLGEEVPVEPFAPQQFEKFLHEFAGLLRRDHDEAYLGIIYVGDLADPTMIKVCDLNNLGTSCGSSGRRVSSSWTLGRTPPVALRAEFPNPGGGCALVAPVVRTGGCDIPQ